MAAGGHRLLTEELTRRGLLRRAGEAALVLSAIPLLPLPPASPPAAAPGAPSLGMSPVDAALQAFADTLIPGRVVSVTESGRPVAPGAIAGVDPLPGAVEADVLALMQHPEINFEPLAPGFVADLEGRSAPHGADFLDLGFADRVAVCLSGLDFSNESRTLWEAAAGVVFTAFCAAAFVGPPQTAARAVGYRVMGLPGAAPGGYRSFSYRRRLSVERTRHGSLP